MRIYQLSIRSRWAVLLSLGSLLPACTDKVTYTKDIAPIISSNCVACHQPGGGAPFNLLTYEDVSGRAKMIAAVTSSRYMPPWPADRSYSGFMHERGLTEKEIELIGHWYRQGARRGEGQPVEVAKTGEEGLGKPDMIIPAVAVQIDNRNRDRFYVLKMPYEMPEQKYVRAVQFVTQQPEYAHHINGHYLSFTEQTDPFAGKRLADLESDSFLQQFNDLKLLNHDGSMPKRVHSAVNYLPGSSVIQYPQGIGGFVMTRKGAFIANDIHYGPSRKNLVDTPKLYIYFSEQPPERPTFELMLGTNGVAPIEPPLQVPAGTISSHVSRITIYNDISVLTVNPHMHLIGRTFKAYAVKPNGDTVRLISIPRWRFRWQYFYTYRNPVRIPKGSTIVVEATFDNTVNNPDNPFNPPRQIGERMDRGGASMRTTDEMLQFIITYMPYEKGDETIDLLKPSLKK
jgi:hypothetical protein